MRPVYADENVWMPVVEGLRRRDWTVTAAVEEGTSGRPIGSTSSTPRSEGEHF